MGFLIEEKWARAFFMVSARTWANARALSRPDAGWRTGTPPDDVGRGLSPTNGELLSGVKPDPHQTEPRPYFFALSLIGPRENARLTWGRGRIWWSRHG